MEILLKDVKKISVYEVNGKGITLQISEYLYGFTALDPAGELFDDSSDDGSSPTDVLTCPKCGTRLRLIEDLCEE